MAKRSRKRKVAGGGSLRKATGVKASVQAPPSWFRRDWLWGLILILFVMVAYTPIWHAGFIWDDDAMLTANPCIVGPLGLKGIWTTKAADICPWVLTTFWVEHALWGLAPLPYHLVNVLMHGACAVLLWRVLRSLRVEGAWLGAALWALHPVAVESVAWITEMKNTESALFFLLSVLFFVKWLKTGGSDHLRSSSYGASADRARSRHSGATAEIRIYRASAYEIRPYWAYILSLLFAALAMASKSSTVILPVVLCLCAWWLEGRWHWRNLVSVVPIFLMSVAASALSLWTQGLQLAMAPDPQWVRPWSQRLAAAGDAVWFYLGKLLWPDPLITIYPRWRIDAANWVSYLPLLAVILLFSILWFNRRSGVTGLRACFFAFAYFLTALSPVLGLIDNSIFRYSLVFDHLQYLASIGPLALVGAGLTWTWEKGIGVSEYRRVGVGDGTSKDKILTQMEPPLRGSRTPNKESLRGLLCKFFLVPSIHTANQLRILVSKNLWLRQALCTGLLLILGIATWQRTRAYENQETLWNDTLAKNPDCGVGYANLGFAFFQKGQADEAVKQFQKALEINPNDRDAHTDLGMVLDGIGRLDEAIAQYQKALKIDPNNVEAHNNLGNTLFRKGQLGEAIAQYQMAVKINPENAEAQGNLGAALFQNGQFDEAMAQYQKSLEINPNYAEAHNNLGNALLQSGQLDRAIEEFQKAIEINPKFAQAHGNLGLAFFRLGQLEDAITECQKALRLDPSLESIRDTFAKAKALEGKK
jgi:tetratricopeptide (TPR) repeat protein